mgnify:CR=1 FL=1
MFEDVRLGVGDVAKNPKRMIAPFGRGLRERRVLHVVDEAQREVLARFDAHFDVVDCVHRVFLFVEVQDWLLAVTNH